MTILNIRDLTVDFKLDERRVTAVRHVSFDIPKGQVIALVGESGSGKSTIGNAILQLLPRTARIRTGNILLRDDTKHETPPIDLLSYAPDDPVLRAIRGKAISMIFQEPSAALSPMHTIGNQITEVLRAHESQSHLASRDHTLTMLARCGFDDPVQSYEKYPFELSGGLRQRAVVAMALVCGPALVIADEPTTALDVTLQRQILELMRELQSELGLSTLLITHDFGVVAEMADEVIVLRDGVIVEQGPVESVMLTPKTPYVRRLLDTAPRLPLGEGASLETSETATEGQHDDIIQIRGATKTFEPRRQPIFRGQALEPICALDRVTLTIRRGECLGLVGESGSGKSTLARAVMGDISLDDGQILYCDGPIRSVIRDLTSEKLKAYRRRVQYVFQDPYGSLNPRMTALEIIREPMIIHSIGSYADQIARAEYLMRAVDLDPACLSRYPHSFSGGERQRIGIARALAVEPSLLLLDEPVSALDVSVQGQILDLLSSLKTTLGLTYFFISHDLSVISEVADRVAVIREGRIVEIAPCRRLFASPAHNYTNELIASIPTMDPTARTIGMPLSNAPVRSAKTPRNSAARLTLQEIAPDHLVERALL